MLLLWAFYEVCSSVLLSFLVCLGIVVYNFCTVGIIYENTMYYDITSSIKICPLILTHMMFFSLPGLRELTRSPWFCKVWSGAIRGFKLRGKEENDCCRWMLVCLCSL